VDEDTQLDDVVALMERNAIKRVPVLRGKRLVGIVTRANLLRALVSALHAAPVACSGDVAIREKILREINNENWTPVATVDAIVRNGVVTLSGFVIDERQRAALKVLVENVPGVKAVRDELVWIDPVSGITIESEETAQNRH
jgi:CBS domain-containing protein